MEVGPVADVLEDMLPLYKRGHADPRRTLAAHVGQERVGMPGVLKLRRHGMTADAAARQLALQQQRGAVVGAAGAEVWKAPRDQAALAMIDLVEQRHTPRALGP